MKIRIDPFRAHFGDLLDLSIADIFEQSAQIGSRVQRPKLLLIEPQCFVDTSLVFEFEVADRSIEGVVAQSPLLVQELSGTAILCGTEEAVVEGFF